MGDEVLATVNDGDHLDGVTMYAVDEAIWKVDELANAEGCGLGNAAARFRKGLSLAKALDNSVEELLGIHRGDETNMLGDRPELPYGVLRPAEREGHDARRMRLRTRDMASSCDTVRPVSASARPVSTAWRTYTS